MIQALLSVIGAYAVLGFICWVGSEIVMRYRLKQSAKRRMGIFSEAYRAAYEDIKKDHAVRLKMVNGDWGAVNVVAREESPQFVLVDYFIKCKECGLMLCERNGIVQQNHLCIVGKRPAENFWGRSVVWEKSATEKWVEELVKYSNLPGKMKFLPRGKEPKDL